MSMYMSPTRMEGSADQGGPKTRTSKKNKKAVVVFSDVFGFASGNHRLFCDEVAKSDGVDVFLPDFFRGHNAMQPVGWLPEMIALPAAAFGMLYRLKFLYTKEAVIDTDCKGLVIPHLKSMGYESFGCVGFCFGGWAVAQCLAMEEALFECGVGIHPSLNVERLHGRKEVDLAKRVGKRPMLFLPAGNDKKEVKPGGDVVKILADERGVDESVISVEFPNMVHGWVTRGWGKDVDESQKRAIELTVEHFKT
eukprot:CAMPEP_0118636104 /NCGR_PEP_ID=MMETSP0785-20121206/2434_1 /TAXON_ID=91992 /ORGANISM="Bolidomonas pacifica, Strain CCMP 1866" /LENGTH=250 /DNA_ID=CAMNT_0006527187 /DNA_START=216 /DNA_END=964 /DNA_ORIENTATION=+